MEMKWYAIVMVFAFIMWGIIAAAESWEKVELAKAEQCQCDCSEE